jgi:endo-1,4-beta-xylanase
LNMAEGYLNGPSPKMWKVVAQLNASLKLSSYAHENLLLAKARPDIEKYRKGDITVIVVDGDGKPIPDCEVSYRQVSHDFLFAVFGVGIPGQDDFKFVDPLKKAGVNFTYTFYGWKNIEPEPGIFDWPGTDYIVEGLLSRGMDRLSGFPCFMYRDKGEWSDTCAPSWWDGMTLEELNSSIYNHMAVLAGHYSQAIKTWQAVELPHAWTNPLHLTWNEKFEAIRAYSEGVKSVDPSLKLVHVANALPFETFVGQKTDSLNETAVSMSFYEFISHLIEKEIPIDIIGTEMINAEEFWGQDLVTISKLLDLYSEFQKPVYLHEFAAPSCQDYTDTWWHRPWDEALQAQFLREAWTIAFSKPLVQEVAWSYAVSDWDTFVRCGGLFDAGGAPKPSYYAMKNLIKSWTTKGSGKTDAKGRLKFRGFAGDYEVTVKPPSDAVAQMAVAETAHTVHVTEQKEGVQIVRTGLK